MPQVGLPPGDLQVQLHRPQVVDVHGECLGERAEQVQHFTGHAAHHHVIGQALKLRDLDNNNKKNSDMRTRRDDLTKRDDYLKPLSLDAVWSRSVSVHDPAVVGDMFFKC